MAARYFARRLRAMPLWRGAYHKVFLGICQSKVCPAPTLGLIIRGRARCGWAEPVDRVRDDIESTLAAPVFAGRTVSTVIGCSKSMRVLRVVC